MVSRGAVALHVESYGSGSPVTVFAPGLGATIAEARVLGSGVGGTRTFFDFRGQGRSGSDGDWSYAALAGDLRAVADAAGATRCAGTSMGAAALLGVLAATPDRFERCVFFLPAILDRPRGDVTAPVDGIAAAGLLRSLRETAPIADRSVLSAVTARCVVVAQEGDDLHPVRVARDLATALPDARLHVFGSDAVRDHRAALRSLVAGFLGENPLARNGFSEDSPLP